MTMAILDIATCYEVFVLLVVLNIFEGEHMSSCTCRDYCIVLNLVLAN